MAAVLLSPTFPYSLHRVDDDVFQEHDPCGWQSIAVYIRCIQDVFPPPDPRQMFWLELAS